MSQPSSATSRSRRRLVASFHDLHPGSRAACDRFLDLLPDGAPAVLLVVPRWHDGVASTDDASFVAWLADAAARGHEICLHGETHLSPRAVAGGLRGFWFHRLYTRGEAEFRDLDRAEASGRIDRGLAMLRTAGFAADGFVAPAWLMSDGTIEAARDHRLQYTVRWGEVLDLARNVVLPAPVVCLSSRSWWRRAISARWARFWSHRNREADILRVAAHPIDLEFPTMTVTLADVLHAASRDRRIVTYDRLVHERSGGGIDR